MIERRLPPFIADPAFFLDVDGTLLEFAGRPQEVRVGAELIELLADLHDMTGGATALVSGRPVEDVDRLFAPLVLPIAGQHGCERRSALGDVRRPAPLPDELRRVRESIAQFASGHPGLELENKGTALALHYRRAPMLRARVEQEMRAAAAAVAAGFELQMGKCVVEIRPRGCDKGSAIGQFMAEPPFAGRNAVFVGDDLTDESGFGTVNRLGGLSIKVGPGLTQARWRLSDVAAVRRWLAAWAEQGAYARDAGR